LVDRTDAYFLKLTVTFLFCCLQFLHLETAAGLVSGHLQLGTEYRQNCSFSLKPLQRNLEYFQTSITSC
jgi:hypothetical protein